MIIEITKNDNLFENGKKTITLKEHVGSATDPITSREFDLSLLGWNSMGLVVTDKTTQTEYSISFEQFIRSIIANESVEKK